MLKKLAKSKLANFIQGFLLSALCTLGYIRADNKSFFFYIFLAILAIIIPSIYFFLFTKQTKEELRSVKTWLLLGLTGGFCFIWGNFLLYVILISH